MRKEEFVENLNIQGTFVSIGLDDNGQSYFMEYVKPNCVNDEIIIENFGSYESDYKFCAEYKLGTYEKCDTYNILTDPLFGDDEDSIGNSNCNCKGAYGYCYACPYYDKSNYNWRKLISLGVINKYGDVNPEYVEFLQPKGLEKVESKKEEKQQPKMSKLVRFLNHREPEKPWIRLCAVNGCKKNYKNTVLIPRDLAEEFIKVATKGKYVELHKRNNPTQYQLWSDYMDKHEGK